MLQARNKAPKSFSERTQISVSSCRSRNSENWSSVVRGTTTPSERAMSKPLRFLRSFCQILILSSLTMGSPSICAPISGYHVSHAISLDGDDGWDYIAIDSSSRQLYVSHGKQVEILDADSGNKIGVIPNTPGVHGVAVAADLKRGFTSNGGDSSVTIFDTSTFGIIRKVPVHEPDFILYDQFTKRVFPMNQKVTVLDATSGEKVGEVPLGGDPEAAISDGKGTVYVNLADEAAIAVVDTQTLSVTKKYSIPGCKSPHSMSFDPDSERLFVGCRDGNLAVVDSRTGKIIDHSLMCSGVDAGAFDEERKLIFESCSEGVISVIKEVRPGDYELIETIKTELLARTMAFDLKTKKLFLPTADLETVPTEDLQRPYAMRVKPGTFRVLVVEP
jgi:DNA-binding beta-propeller fold protein YncE